MKFLVLFLATAAIASASIIGSRKVHVTEDGTIVIQGDDGKQVQIKKDGPYGQKNIEIDVTAPNTLAKRIHINNDNLVSIERGVEYTIPTNDDDSSYLKNKRSYTTEELLNEIFKNNLGYVDDDSYQTLLEKVQKAVLNGNVEGTVLNVLKGLKRENAWSNQISGQEDLNTLKTQHKYSSQINGNGQYDVQYIYNILYRIFDQEVLKMVLKQNIYGQDYFVQKSIEALWDAVFSQQGIFDSKLLVKIINDKILRNYFVAQGFFDKDVLDQIAYAYKTEGTYDQYLLQRLVNIQNLKQFFINRGVSVYDILGKTYNNQYYGQEYNQYDAKYFFNVLIKIFDRQVLKTILSQENIYNQEMYGQYNYEKLWDMVFAHQGVFDYQYLVEIINNKVLRNYFVQQGFFDRVILEKIIVAYKTEGVYDQYLLQRLVNTQVLKYFFIQQRVSVYDILNQTSYNKYYGKTFYNQFSHNSFNNKYYGNSLFNKGISGYDMLEKIIGQPIYRNIMVQYGIFNKNILDQILYQYRAQGVYDEVLLRQLVNKDALYKVLVQYGVVDQALLREYVNNEYLALNYLYRNNFFYQQSPRLSSDVEFLPEYNQNTQVYPHGGSYFRDLMYGQKYNNINRWYNKGYYGKYYNQYNQYPTTVEQTY